jgi:hypothetical protein
VTCLIHFIIEFLQKQIYCVVTSTEPPNVNQPMWLVIYTHCCLVVEGTLRGLLGRSYSSETRTTQSGVNTRYAYCVCTLMLCADSTCNSWLAFCVVRFCVLHSVQRRVSGGNHVEGVLKKDFDWLRWKANAAFLSHRCVDAVMSYCFIWCHGLGWHGMSCVIMFFVV